MTKEQHCPVLPSPRDRRTVVKKWRTESYTDAIARWSHRPFRLHPIWTRPGPRGRNHVVQTNPHLSHEGMFSGMFCGRRVATRRFGLEVRSVPLLVAYFRSSSSRSNAMLGRGLYPFDHFRVANDVVSAKVREPHNSKSIRNNEITTCPRTMSGRER